LGVHRFAGRHDLETTRTIGALVSMYYGTPSKVIAAPGVANVWASLINHFIITTARPAALERKVGQIHVLKRYGHLLAVPEDKMTPFKFSSYLHESRLQVHLER